MEFNRLMHNMLSSQEMNNKCIFCNSLLSGETNFQEFPIHCQLTSTFLEVSDSYDKTLTHHLFSPAKCPNCGSIQIATNSPLKVHSFSDHRIKYNEPSYHLDEISIAIRSVDSTLKLKCYSYKDHSLAANIQSQLLHNISYDNSEDVSGEAAVIHIARRFIEHFTCQESLNNFLAGINKDDFLYLEILDFSEQEHPLFLWDERHLYPSSHFLVSLFERVGFELIFQKTFRKGEPFHSMLFQRTGLQSLDNLAHFPHENHPVDIFGLYRKIINVSKDLTASASNLNFYGISHKALTLATFCKSINQDTLIKLYDSSEFKVNKFWHNIQIKSFDSLESDHNTHHIFSFGGNNASQLRNRLPKNSKMSSLSNFF